VALKQSERVWLGLGSNLGDSRKILQEAWEVLGRDPDISRVLLSSPYASDPVGMESENRFLNAVGIIETRYDPLSLLTLLQQVEKSFGRKEKTGKEGYQDRLLDLDILYFGTIQSRTEKLQIPHPQIASRLFVLTPLMEIDALHTDPSTKKTVTQMHSELIVKIENGEIAPQEMQRQSWPLEG